VGTQIVDPGLLAALRADEPLMVEQLRDLVNAESPTADLEAVGACAALIEGMGTSSLGIAPERVIVDGRTHLRWRLGGSPRVLLVGHFDTVWPSGTLARWPFNIEDGKATGPGAFDMKAGIVQMFHALASLPSRDGVTCILTSDEEIGSPTSRALIEETATGAIAALVLEPSADGAFKTGRKGTSMYQLHVVGRAAHAGLEPERGANATIELAHQVLAVAALARPDLGTTVTPTVASAGTTTNTVPALATLDVDVRVATLDEQRRVDVEMRSLQPVVAGTTVTIGGGPNRPPFARSASASLLERAQRVATALGIDPPNGVEVGGASDGNFTAGIGVPTLDGMGAVGAGAHAEGEYAVLSAMPERAALLAGLISDLLAQADPSA